MLWFLLITGIWGAYKNSVMKHFALCSRNHHCLWSYRKDSLHWRMQKSRSGSCLLLSTPYERPSPQYETPWSGVPGNEGNCNVSSGMWPMTMSQTEREREIQNTLFKSISSFRYISNLGNWLNYNTMGNLITCRNHHF